MAHVESKALQDRLVKLLRSEEVLNLNFDVLNVRIRGSAYNKVIDAIGAQSSNGISLEINPEDLKRRGANAAYHPYAKTLAFKSESIGSGQNRVSDNMIIVHEATHALIDLTFGGTLDSITTETAAYIAEGAYNHLTGFKNKRKTVLGKAADAQGRKVAANEGGYSFTPNEIGDLVQAIKLIYSNRDVDTEGSRTVEFVDPEGQWEVTAHKTMGGPARWRWIYTFSSGGGVRWEDPANGLSGEGKWQAKRSDHRVYIKWRSGSTDTFDLPMNVTESKEIPASGSAIKMVGDANMRSEGKWKLYATRI